MNSAKILTTKSLVVKNNFILEGSISLGQVPTYSILIKSDCTNRFRGGIL